MKLFLKGMPSDLLGRTRYLFSLLKAEIKKVRLELSVTFGNNERKISQKYQIHTQGKGLGGFAEKMFSEWTAVSNTGASTTEPFLMSFLVPFHRYCR